MAWKVGARLARPTGKRRRGLLCVAAGRVSLGVAQGTGSYVMTRSHRFELTAALRLLANVEASTGQTHPRRSRKVRLPWQFKFHFGADTLFGVHPQCAL